MNDDIEPHIAELRNLSEKLQQLLTDGDKIIEAIDEQLAALAAKRPHWQIVLIADVFILHQSEVQSHEARVLSAGIRIPGDVSVCMWKADAFKNENDGKCEHIENAQVRFLPFSKAPALIQRLVLPLIPYTLDAICDQLESRI